MASARCCPRSRRRASRWTASRIRRAVRWLAEHQNQDGGFGEGCQSYVIRRAAAAGRARPRRPHGRCSGSRGRSRRLAGGAARGGAPVTRQRDDGAWDEDAYTGCGFPGYGVGEPDGARSREGSELSRRLLDPLSPLPQLLPAARARRRSRRRRSGGACMRPFAFYQDWLDAVSRSFALCIPQLESPFRDQVALSYLLLARARHGRGRALCRQGDAAAAVRRLRGFLRERPRRPTSRRSRGVPRPAHRGERGLMVRLRAAR